MSGKKAEKKCTEQWRKQWVRPPPQQEAAETWQKEMLRRKVTEALVHLKQRAGSTARAVRRYLSELCAGEGPWQRLPSTAGVLATLRTVARNVHGRWLLLLSAAGLTAADSDSLPPLPLPSLLAAPVSPPVSPVDETQQQDVADEEEQAQWERLKTFINESTRRGGRSAHEKKSSHFVSARTLHGPVSVEMDFVTSRRSMELEQTVYNDEMRGRMTVTLGSSHGTLITGVVSSSTKSGGAQQKKAAARAVRGALHADGSATLTLGDLQLQTADLATATYTCLRRGGSYVDWLGSDTATSEACMVRTYCMVQTKKSS